MSAIKWPEHPLFSARSREEFSQSIEMFDDGVLFLDEAGDVLQMNSESCRILCADVVPQLPRPLSQLNSQAPINSQNENCKILSDAIEGGQRREIVLRGAGGRQIMATFRRKKRAGRVRMILLRDLDGILFRRQRAMGARGEGEFTPFLGRRTRPDFETQRRISPQLHRLLTRGERAIRQDARILITGESGVGKSEIARFLHNSVADASAPFITANCAASSAAALEEALFGRVPGGHGNLIERARGGSLFLDEVSEIPMEIQAKILGFLEDGVMLDGAGAMSGRTNVRVLAATNANLGDLVRQGRFRADLFYRLSVVELAVPPLRSMPDLVPHLVDRFVETMNHRRETPVIIPARFREILNDYSFPGNIRELLNIVQKAVIFIEDAQDFEELIADLLKPIDISATANEGHLPDMATLDLKTEVRRYELALIDRAIRIHGSKRQAAKVLGVNIGTIVRKTTASDKTTASEKEVSTTKTMEKGSMK